MPTFRHKRFKEYKAHRPPTPPELRSQFERVRQLIDAFEIPVYQCEGYEADDVLGTLCRQAEEQEIETVIFTGDSDTLQLVSPWVRVFMSSSVQQAKVYDVAGVKDRFGGLGPEAVADIKALQGDSSDNIPGVPGVRVKTAVKSRESSSATSSRSSPTSTRSRHLAPRRTFEKGSSSSARVKC